jgi:pyridoxine 4-dehydrogenase
VNVIEQAGSYTLGTQTVGRLGYGAMQLAGPHVFGPPRNWDAALAVLRAAVEAGVTHIDTSDFYGPHVVNRLIREALSPYPENLVLVTKVGAVRGDDASWNLADSPDELRRAVEDNLANLGLDRLEVVNFRSMLGGGTGGPMEGSIAEPFKALARMREEGLIRHLGVSNVTAAQVAQARGIAPVACVQNMYNLAHRDDDALIDALAADGIAYVPFFPLGGFSPLQSTELSQVAEWVNATPLQVALAWLLRRSPNILAIPGTSSVAHLSQNLAAAALPLPDDAMLTLNGIGSHSVIR